MFILGDIYKRSDLHRLYGGQKQGGISTPSGGKFLMLFTGETGLQYGYQDGWSEEGVFFYTGEGQRGDMLFVRGNLAIRDHVANGKDIHLLESVRKGDARYIGQMICTGFHGRRGPDIDGKQRSIIVFELMPVDAFEKAVVSVVEREDEEIWQQSLAILRERAIASSNTARSPSERKVLARYRSDVIRVYVLKRANGVCEACTKNAPFRTNSGRPYLEPHHIRRLSDAGPDDPRWVVALCPNCHRRAHYGEDKDSFNNQLTDIVIDKEKQ